MRENAKRLWSYQTFSLFLCCIIAFGFSKFSYAEEPPTYIGTFGSQGVINGISDVAIDSQDHLYVLSRHNSTVIKFNKNNEVLAQWGGYGNQPSVDGTLQTPQGIALDAQGNVYIADTGLYRIQKFDSNGNFLAKILLDTSSFANLNTPTDVAVDANGKVYVVDQVKSFVRIYIPNSTGTAYTQQTKEWGTKGVSGNTDSTFYNPSRIAIAGNYAYIADAGNSRVVKYDLTAGENGEGAYVAHWGSYGTGLGQFITMNQIAVGADGKVYVADNNRIQSFNNDGTNPQQWSPPNSDSTTVFATDSQGFFYITAGSENSFINSGKLHQYDSNKLPQNVFIGYLTNQPGKMSQPIQGVAINSQGEIYVADAGNNRIEKYSSQHEFLTHIATAGSDLGKVNNPSSIAIDEEDHLYVVENSNARIQKWDGNTWTAWGSFGYASATDPALDKLYQPDRIAVGGNYLYVTDTGNNRLKMMDKHTGTVLTTTSLTAPKALAVDHAPPNDSGAIAHVYVVDSSGLVKKFRVLLSSTGAYSLSFSNSYNYNPSTGGFPNTLAVYNHQLYLSIQNETANGIMQKRDSSGNLLTAWGKHGTRNGELNQVRAMAFTPTGNIYVANSVNRRVDIYYAQPTTPTPSDGAITAIIQYLFRE